VAGLLAIVATLADRRRLWPALRSTAGPFLTLAVVIGAGFLCERLGVFRVMASTFIPGRWSGIASFAAVLAFTAVVSGVINLDVSVVVAMPVALDVAAQKGLPASWPAVSVALTANASSFLLPTSNITNLLVLSRSPNPAGSYLRHSWLAWLMVATPTVLALSVLLARRSEGARPTPTAPATRTSALQDLPAMYVGELRPSGGILGSSLVLHGGFARQAVLASVLAAAVNNLPAAAAVHAVGTTARWATILSMAAGPNLLVTGSVATLICRRIARARGVPLGTAKFSAMGGALVPLQLFAAAIGLHLVGAIR
jgi:Na+/H+ antiporter NhaD/arsenite permease-like protein